MQKVQISCYGREIIIDSDQVKLHEKKWALVQEGVRLGKLSEVGSYASKDSIANCEKIIRINRRIRKNVQFTK